MLDNLIKTIPPVTRTILFILLIGMILTYAGYLNRYDMYFSVSKIMQGEVAFVYILGMETRHIAVLH